MSLKIGHQKERLAMNYLTARGFKIIARNYRIRQGEVDIIALQGDALVFIEVKYRSSDDHGKAFEYVRPYKVRRIMKAAWHFIQTAERLLPTNYRIDVIAIDGQDISYYKDIPTTS